MQLKVNCMKLNQMWVTPVMHCGLITWNLSWNCGCLVIWFCYQLIAKPDNKTAAVPWPDPYCFTYRKHIQIRCGSLVSSTVVSIFQFVGLVVFHFSWYKASDYPVIPCRYPLSWHAAASWHWLIGLGDITCLWTQCSVSWGVSFVL